MKDLSKRQREVLRQIALVWQNGSFPIVRELAQSMGLAGESSLTPTLQRLQNMGLVQIQGGVRGKPRVISLTPQGKAACGLGLPVLGSIPAGPLREALDSAEEYADSASELLPSKPGDFLLRVTGDSMIGDGILAGDLVLLRPNVALHQGEIAAVQVGGDATLKHFFQEPASSQIILRSSNPNYADIEVPVEDVSIVGAFRGLIRPSKWN
jgi:repressor LexA